MKYISILIIILATISCNTQNNDEYKLSVGAASKSINPDPGAFIAGDKNNRQFTGIHDSLYVKAVVVSNPESSIAILTFDCIGLLYPTLQEIRERVSKKISSEELNPKHIVMSSTHTHSGPDVVGIWGPDQLTSGVDNDYLDNLIESAVEVIEKALQDQEPAKLVYAESEFGHEWVYNISDSLNLDRSLTTIQFLNSKQKSVATLSNFACHPTIMDGVSDLVSADYIGAFYESMDQQLGGINLFLQGALGGWVQPEYEKKIFESTQKRGLELANAVMSNLKSPQQSKSYELKFASKEISLPVSNENFQILSEMGVFNRPINKSVTSEIALFSIGDAQFVTHPGETSPIHSLLSKKAMKTQGPKFVMGLGMDALGYILTPDFYLENPKVRHTDYLKSMSIDKNTGEIMMESILDLADTN